VRTLIAAAALTLFAFSALASPATKPNGGRPAESWDHELDVTGKTCGDIQEALRDYNDGDDLTPFIRITGTLDIDFDDLHTAQWKDASDDSIETGVYKYCFGEIPSETYETDANGFDWPVSDGTENNNSIRGNIFFDNVVITYSATASTPDQSVPIVIWQAGDQYQNGRLSGAQTPYGGYFSSPPKVSGSLYIRFSAALSTGITQGTLPGRSASTLFESQTTAVGIWIQGMLKRDWQDLTVQIDGAGSDNDDIGIWHDYGGSNSFGRIKAQNLAVGILMDDFLISDYNDVYITGNEYGVLLGERLQGCGMVNATSCVAGTDGGDCGTRAATCAALRINGGTIEGNSFGEFVTYGGTQYIANTHIEVMELGGMRGHGLLIGAGYCNGGAPPTGRDKMACGTDAGGSAGLDDCPNGGTCTCPSNSTITDLIITGGDTPGDKFEDGTSHASVLSDWGGTMVGKCADDSASKITINSNLTASTLSTGEAVAFQWASSELTAPTNMPDFHVDSILRAGGFFWPNYPQLSHSSQIHVPFYGQNAAWTTGNYMQPFEYYTGTGLASTDPTAFVPIPWAKVKRWQVHRVDCGHIAASTGTDVAVFKPVIADYGLTSLTPVDDVAVSYADTTATAANEIVSKALAPNSEAMINTTASPTQAMLGLRVDFTGGETELRDICTVTLIPLE
jgi:hypothetical protein